MRGIILQNDLGQNPPAIHRLILIHRSFAAVKEKYAVLERADQRVHIEHLPRELAMRFAISLFFGHRGRLHHG